MTNPATEAVFGSVASASASDLNDTLASAEASRRGWASRSSKDRGEILTAAARILATKVGDAARELSREQGKTIAEATGEYARAVETLEWYGAHAEELCAPTPHGSNRMIIPEPLGVAAAFTPWNYPAVIIARKLAPAL
ncbi:aldehyde dehydrogenase family protein, partial [Mesorhizobium sp. M0871]|uniref:aldehyde dehydrogenase family protein n=1 Tax=Mesorhizobium sp. M0871 TaxID=2957017 RepID=UPI00333DD519